MPDAFLQQLRSVLSPAYELERELVGGGMSRVFVATERALGRTVVIKVLPPDLAAGVNRERFQREIQLAARLHHPHIVPLFNAGEQGPLLYYTMPFIEGESLKEALRRRKRLPVREVVRILHDVVDALAYAHARGVVHRDIKPGNILTQGTHALVTDFGVAKALSAALPISGTTSAGIAIGTPAYMAPEQLAADPKADHRMDLYAVGLLAYELLTGDSPFVSASPQETLAAQLTRMPTPLDQCCPDVPPELSAVIMRCLEKSPANRPPTAEVLLDQLDAVTTPQGGLLASPAGRATGPSLSGRTVDPITAGEEIDDRTPARSDATTLDDIEWPPRRRWSRIFLGTAAALALAGGGVVFAMRAVQRPDTSVAAAADSARPTTTARPSTARPRSSPGTRTRTGGTGTPRDTSIAGAFRGAAVDGVTGARSRTAGSASSGTGAAAAGVGGAAGGAGGAGGTASRPQLTRADSLAIAEAVRRSMRQDAGVDPRVAISESLATAMADSVRRTIGLLERQGYLDARYLDSATIRELSKIGTVRVVPVPPREPLLALPELGRRRLALFDVTHASDSPDVDGLGTRVADSIRLEIERRGAMDVIDATTVARDMRTNSATRVASAVRADVVVRGDYHVRQVGVVVHLTLTDTRTRRSLSVNDTLPGPAPLSGAGDLARRVADGVARVLAARTAPRQQMPAVPPPAPPARPAPGLPR